MSDEKTTNLSSITGANLADNDLVMVVDVSDTTMAATGTNKKVTLNEFAQDSTFSSRYKPLASDTIWIDARQFVAAEGSPTLTGLYVGAGWQLDSSGDEQLQTNVYFPPSWNTFSVDVWWSNVVGGGSGDVRFRVYWTFHADGDAYDSGLVDPPGVNVTAAAAKIVKKSQLQASQAVTVGNMADFTVFRNGSAVADTLANDINIHGVLLTRLT